jgi:two-component system response regulator DevR
MGTRCSRRPIAGPRRTGDTRTMLRVALLDDHPAVLAGLRRLIEREPDLTVVAATSDPTALQRLLDRSKPDVLVLDHHLGDGDGLTHCLRVKRRARPPAVLVYSAYTGPALTLAARAAGANGLVDKAEPVRWLLSAIRTVAAGRCVMPVAPRDAQIVAARRVDAGDLPVLAMLLDGTTVDDIAATLRTDPGTVAWQAQRIVGRLSAWRQAA